MAIKLIQPGNNFLVESQFTKAVQLLNAGDSVGASNLLQANLKANPRHYESLYLHGLISAQNSQWHIAVEFFSKALQIKNNDASIYNNLGNVLFELKRLDESLASFNKAIDLKPDYAQAYFNLGMVLSEFKRWADALKAYEKAIEFNQAYAEAYFSRGVVLSELGRFEESLMSYEKAIGVRVDYAQAYLNKGLILQELNRLDEALENYDRAIEIKCDYADAYLNRGNVFKKINRLQVAITNYEQVLKIEPNYKFVLGLILYNKMCLCDWRNFESNLNELVSRINAFKKASPCFQILSLIDSPAIHKIVSETWINEAFSANLTLGPILKYPYKDKIRIGYYSADFREHPVSYLTAELFELSNKDLFEIYAFYYGPADDSKIQKRISSTVDKFIDVRLCPDIDVARMSREFSIDIAVDLTGHTQGGRCGIFSYRAAPIQLSYIGYLGTMGAEYYDYLVADKIIVPVENQKYYTEKILYLPSYQANDTKREISGKIFSRADFNLPATGFVFCCFNQSYKITPATFDVWMEILKLIPDSVLFLYANNAVAETNLKAEAERRGVSQARLFFGATMERAEYLARYRVADLFLDTLPYNAGTTASDALWAGLPVLTCMGESFASRTASSLLTAIDLPELITVNYEEYKKVAVELATNSSKFEAIKGKLKKNLKTTILFDSLSFTKSLESAYINIYEQYQSDRQPE